MSYRSLEDCVLDLERNGYLRRVTETIDPRLELAEIQRRAYAAGAPALLFEHIEGCKFPVLGNLFGDIERCRFIFRHTLDRVRKIVQLKADSSRFWRQPWTYAMTPLAALKSLPLRGFGAAPVLADSCRLSDLPQIVSWPDDGGAFITLPQVYSEDPRAPGILHSNLGMYRVQISGGDYKTDDEAGLHYQIHRGIGVHHSRALERGEPLRVSVFVGGPPAHTLAAVMPLPEGLSELLFAGMLGGRHFRHQLKDGFRISRDADFCITGTIDPGRTLPEGPFGDHLGYYSLRHEFPVLRVEKIYHRRGAIWPFTVVGRPPQEDTSFGQLIHEITAPVVPTEIPGVRSLHAVDAAGVHPLLLAIGSERYVPYGERKPRELLTQANAILGFGQCSLAKYLWITATEDAPDLDIQDIGAFLRHALERVDWQSDLHFQTRTTIDTLDYSGTALNEGSKLVVAAAGERRRTLIDRLPDDFRPPSGWTARMAPIPGILILEGPGFRSYEEVASDVATIEKEPWKNDGLPLIVWVDDADFAARNLKNFLWVTFTRSNPSHDIHGMGSVTEHKHWGCSGPLIIDARLKPHHAPPLIEDPEVSRKVDALSTPGKSLHGII